MQQNALSVCEVLQNAMQKLYGVRPDVKGCSRTDSGVHALDYCVSFVQPKQIEMFRLPLAINRFLPKDIRVMSAKSVPDCFHARYSAISKEYIYRILNSRMEDPFLHGLAWRCAQKMNISEMQIAAKEICGTNDYAAFMSAGSKMIDTVRTVHSLTISTSNSEIVFHICADGYLYNMVRIIVGTLCDVGTGRISALDIRKIIKSRDRGCAGETAPAQGLYLYKVNYEDAYAGTKD